VPLLGENVLGVAGNEAFFATACDELASRVMGSPLSALMH
jgi:hypothetical protein